MRGALNYFSIYVAVYDFPAHDSGVQGKKSITHHTDCGYKNYAELARFAPDYPDAKNGARFHIMRDEPKTTFFARAFNANLASFDEFEYAVAAVGNCETFYGDYLRIEQDGKVVWDAEWHETIGRYLNQ